MPFEKGVRVRIDEPMSRRHGQMATVVQSVEVDKSHGYHGQTNTYVKYDDDNRTELRADWSLVAVHDAREPMVSRETIERLNEECNKTTALCLKYITRSQRAVEALRELVVKSAQGPLRRSETEEARKIIEEADADEES